MKRQLKQQAADILENIGNTKLTAQGCQLFWGEVELPECLRKEVESEEE